MVFKKKAVVVEEPVKAAIPEEIKEEKVEEQEEERFEMSQVPTQFEPTIKDKLTGEDLTMYQAVILILNNLERLEENLVG